MMGETAPKWKNDK